ncbi:MAG TPA: DUF72 domain-containing protein [Desulfobacteria bacterium]|nr:DUF72 domain-containing protein [Desulfobacteria bacterium]
MEDALRGMPEQFVKVLSEYLEARSDGPVLSGIVSAWARWILKQLAAGQDVYAYFNNDAEGHAVRNAASLKRYVVGD